MAKTIQQTISEKFTKLKNKDEVYNPIWTGEELDYITSKINKDIDFVTSVQLISNDFILSNEVNEDLSDIIIEFVKIMNKYDTIMDAFDYFIEKHEYFQYNLADDRISDFILELKENKDINRYLSNNLIKSKLYDLF